MNWTKTMVRLADAGARTHQWCSKLFLPDQAASAERLFTCYLACATCTALGAAYGWQAPDPSVHWPGHSWIHFMKRAHVIMSIGAFLIEVCAMAFSLFALMRVLAGSLDTRASSTAVLLVRELEFEFVAVCSYFFAGAMLLLGPIAIRCFCMVQVRSQPVCARACTVAPELAWPRRGVPGRAGLRQFLPDRAAACYSLLFLAVPCPSLPGCVRECAGCRGARSKGFARTRWRSRCSA